MDLDPRRPLLPLGRGGGDAGGVCSVLKAWARPVGGRGEGSGALRDTAPSSPAGPGNKAAMQKTTARLPVGGTAEPLTATRRVSR